jgi:hypothetical protein
MARPRKKHSPKWDRCVRKVKRRRTAVSAPAVCTAVLKPRKSNPRQVALYAQARGTPVLKYIGGIKFARRGRPVKFDNQQHALAVGRELKAQFSVLRKYRLWAA